MARIDLEPDRPDNEIVRESAHKLHEQLKHYFWTNGGFLSGIGEAKDSIIVMLDRDLRPNEVHLVPSEINGVPVITKIIGRITIGG